MKQNSITNIFFFQIELATSCKYDYVEIRDGGVEKAKLLDRVCSNNKPKSTYKSTGNKMYIKFHSDQRDTRKGFSASFKTGKK